MTGVEPIAIAALSRAVDFLFDEAGRLLQERREVRKIRGEDISTDDANSGNRQPTSKAEVKSWQPKNVYLKDVPEEVKHCLDQIHQYRSNRRHLESQIASYGGLSLAPIPLYNQVKVTDDEIAKWCQRLKDIVEQVYGHQITILGWG